MGYAAHFLLQPFGVIVRVTPGVPPNVRAAIEDACMLAGVVLINAQVRGNERQMRLEVTIDSASGVTHDDCRAVSRSLDERLESDDFYGRLRAVEVSSPGADAPVAFLWQLEKHIGRTVHVKKIDGTSIEGTLLSVNELGLEIQPKSKLSQPSTPISIPKAEITETHVVLQF